LFYTENNSEQDDDYQEQEQLIQEGDVLNISKTLPEELMGKNNTQRASKRRSVISQKEKIDKALAAKKQRTS
jgi:hypothetical protein